MFAETILKRTAEYLAEVYKPRQVIMFRPDAIPDESRELDLMVICGERTNRALLWKTMDYTFTNLGIATDVVVLTEEEFERDRLEPGTLANYALARGKTICQY